MNDQTETEKAEIIAFGLELAEYIKDIPAQIELSTRANLAKSFIFKDSSGFKFDKEKFEKVWQLLTQDENQEKLNL
jgi:hypothetical protein